MKKLLLATLLCLSINAYSEDFTCPQQITCHYKSGKCDGIKDESINDFALDPFETDTKTMNLSEARAFIQLNGTIFINCFYKYSQNSYISINSHVNKLYGNDWNMYGFGTHRALCDLAKGGDCHGVV